MKMTVQKMIAETGLASRRALRRQIRYLIAEDGSKRTLDETVEIGPEWQTFALRDTPFRVRAAPPAAIAYHKRLDEVVSRRPDGGARPVFEIMDERYPFELIAVGRLDRLTTGLLLLTQDGTLVHRLTHPKYEVVRRYRVTTEAALPAEGLARACTDGVELRDGHVTRPLTFEALEDSCCYELTLREGKYHEVRRLCAALGSEVTALSRVAYGPVELDALSAGDDRRIEGDALAALYASVGLSVPDPVLEVSFEAELPADADDASLDDSSDSNQGDTGI